MSPSALSFLPFVRLSAQCHLNASFPQENPPSARLPGKGLQSPLPSWLQAGEQFIQNYLSPEFTPPQGFILLG